MPDDRFKRLVIRALRMALEALEGVPSTSAPLVFHLRPKERKLLAVASAAPQSGKLLAKLAGLSTNADTRDALANLQRMGMLVRGPDGYRLP